MVECDYYNIPDTEATTHEGIDHDYDGFFCDDLPTPPFLASLKMWLFKQGTPTGGAINLLHMRGSSVINTYSNDDDLSWSDLTTSTSGQLVTWTLSPNPEIFSDSRFVLEDSGSGTNRGKSLSKTVSPPTGLNLLTQYSNNEGSTWNTATGHILCGCATVGSGTGTATGFPPPPYANIGLHGL